VKRVAILFTSGVESTALIEHAIKENVQFDLVHAEYSNKSWNETPHCKNIAVHYDKEVYTLAVRNDRFNEDYPDVHRDVVLWLGYSMGALQRANYDEVWFGNHRGEMDDTNSWKMFDAWDIMIELGGMNHTTELKCPLMELTKHEQWCMIPDNIKPLCVGCEWLTNDDNDNPILCGKCGKCREWENNNIVIDAS